MGELEQFFEYFFVKKNRQNLGVFHPPTYSIGIVQEIK